MQDTKVSTKPQFTATFLDDYNDFGPRAMIDVCLWEESAQAGLSDDLGALTGIGGLAGRHIAKNKAQ